MKKLRVLIVDNDEDEQLFMREGFNSTGLFDIVGQPENGDELFTWLKANKDNLPDLILSDLNMHGKNGYDILAEIKDHSNFGHIPVVITTTSALPNVQEKCNELGAAGFVLKPETFVNYKTYAEDLYRQLFEKHVVK